MTTTPDTVKQRAHAVIDGLPDDAKWNDIVEALAVIEDVDAGLAESDLGLGVDTETLRRWYGVAE